MLDRVKFFGVATVGTKGQIVIPAEARENQDLKEGDKLVVVRGAHGGLHLIKTDQLEKMIENIQEHSNHFQSIIELTENGGYDDQNENSDKSK